MLDDLLMYEVKYWKLDACTKKCCENAFLERGKWIWKLFKLLEIGHPRASPITKRALKIVKRKKLSSDYSFFSPTVFIFYEVSIFGM